MTEIPTSPLGRTKLQVTKLGYGAMELRGGRRRTSQPEDVERLLHSVLDAGINFIDTSPDYGHSEESIGQYISHRRDEFFLASKCGCPVGWDPASGQRPAHSFTRANIRAGVEQSLARMKTDHLDLVQIHASPSRAELEELESIEEMRALQREGKVRFLGMSGTLPHLPDHIDMGVFDAFQIPYSALERHHEELLTTAADAGAGVIVRGGVARGIPVTPRSRLEQLPERFRQVFGARMDRWDEARLDEVLEPEMTRMELMLRFTLSHPSMATTIVGTANLEHLAQNVEAARKGPLAPTVYKEAIRRLESLGA